MGAIARFAERDPGSGRRYWPRRAGAAPQLATLRQAAGVEDFLALERAE